MNSKRKNNKESILFLDQYGGLGGGQTIFLDLLNVAVQSDFRVITLFPFGGALERKIKDQFNGKIESMSIRRVALSKGKKKWYDVFKLLFFTVYFVFRFYSPFRSADIVYVNGGRLFIPSMVISFLVGGKFIYHVHLDHSPLEKYILLLILKLPRTYKIIVNSRFVLEKLQGFDRSFKNQMKVILIENSLTEAFSSREFVDRFSNNKKLNISIIGKICEEKGQNVLLEIAPEFRDTKFFVIGDYELTDSEYFEGLKRKVPQNVVFYGSSEDIARTIDSLPIHISVVPSRWHEPFGLVAIESMACSCITITSTSGELKNISKKTSAFTYSNTDELINIIRSLQKSGHQELRDIAYRQYINTMKQYSNERFNRQIRTVLNEATV